MNILISKIMSIGLIATMLATPCLAIDQTVNKQSYASAAEMAKSGVYSESMLRNIYDDSKSLRSTQYTETGNNISFVTADNVPIDPEQGQETHMFGYLSAENDEDYYKITPPRHGRVYVVVVSPTGYTYEATVYDSNQNEISCDTVPSTMKSFMATKGTRYSSALSTYYIKVTSTSNYSTNRYRLIVFYALNYQNLNCEYPTTNTLTNITSPVGYRYLGKHEYHPGVDIPGSTSDTIYSICDSVVIRSYNQTYLSDGSLGMGQFVQAVTFFAPDSEYDDILDQYTDTWYAIRYMHLSERYVNTVSTFTGVQEIAKGEPIGKMGNTGYSTGVHLHIDINNGGHYLTNDIENDRQSIINPVDLYDMSFTGSVY